MARAAMAPDHHMDIRVQPQTFTLETARGPSVEPCTLVIFGASGDLARRKLVPALYNLLLDGVLPPSYAVLGVGRKPVSDQDFRSGLREAASKYSRRPLVDRTWSEFEQRLFYLPASTDEPKAFVELKSSLEKIEADLHLPGHRL